MNWMQVLTIRKFTPIEDVFRICGEPQFKLANRNVFYMGGGFLLGFCEKKYSVSGMQRKEYGEKGEYALNVNVFINQKELAIYHKLRQETYEFESDTLCEPFEIFEGMTLGTTFQQASHILLQRIRSPQSYVNHYVPGESRGLNEQKEFVFEYRWIRYGNYEFFFFGEEANTKMSGFEYILND